MLEEWWVEPPLEHVNHMDVEFYGAARGDLDNRVGSVLDAMVQAKVVVDDNVNVVPKICMSFTKAKPADAQIYIKLTWGEK
jgi:Holliday junction resolvase RusA-like endonuclease